MKAAVYYGSEDVRVEQVPDPGPPVPGDVVLKVLEVALCGSDASRFRLAPKVPLTERHPISGHLGPFILGHEVVGVVTAIGEQVDGLEVGQRVVPGCGWWCGTCPQCLAGRLNTCEAYYVFGLDTHGGMAELASFPSRMCIPVPDACSVEAAAMAQPCAVALHALQRGGIQPGQTIALFGVGSIGSLLLATLRAQRADVAVIALDLEADRLTTAKTLGAMHVIDVSDEDAVGAILDLTRGRGVDLAIEATGAPETIARALAAVSRGGSLLQVGIPPRPVSLPIDQAVLQEKRLIPTNGQVTPHDLPEALRLLAETDLANQVGYQVIPLDAVVEQGLRPLAAHRASQKMLVQVAGSLQESFG